VKPRAAFDEAGTTPDPVVETAIRGGRIEAERCRTAVAEGIEVGGGLCGRCRSRRRGRPDHDGGGCGQLNPYRRSVRRRGDIEIDAATCGHGGTPVNCLSRRVDVGTVDRQQPVRTIRPDFHGIVVGVDDPHPYRNSGARVDQPARDLDVEVLV